MPAQPLQAVVIELARQVVEGVAEQVYIAPLEGSFVQDLADRHAKAYVIVGDDELDAVDAPPSGSRGWPFRPPGSGGARPSRRRWRVTNCLIEWSQVRVLLVESLFSIA
jgi:hypothetical protein